MRKDWKRPLEENSLEEGKRRIVLSVSYEGTRFNGWQAQDDKKGVQDVIERAILNITGEEVRLVASGRTDSKVHAISQTCNFDTASDIPIEKFPLAINSQLPQGVKVMSAREENGYFSSRFSALAREYRYYIKQANLVTPFEEERVWGIRHKASLKNLNQLAKLIEGEHDFAFLSLKEDEGKSTKRDIYVSEFYKEGEYMVYRIVGNAFLYHQVRSLVGTLVETERRTSSLKEAKELLEKIMNSKERNNNVFTAPPYGLYFYKTVYDESEWEELASKIENGYGR